MDTDAYAYNYDPIGNRQSAKLNDDTTSYAANALNQYATITEGAPVSPTYDFDGNMLTTLTHAFAWDAENRLITASNLTGGVVASYTYDHQSRRIYKTVVNSSILSYISSFTYDGWNLIQEVSTYVSIGTISTNLYVWGLDLSGSLQGAGGVGGLLSQTIITPTTASSYFPLADANGNAVTYLDDAGNVQAHYTYDAFGGTVSQSGNMTDYFRFRFSSKYLDDETGLLYYGYRYYAPALGRWVNRDPIGERGGLLLYGFVRNDGANKWDLLGLTNEPGCFGCDIYDPNFFPREKPECCGDVELAEGEGCCNDVIFKKSTQCCVNGRIISKNENETVQISFRKANFFFCGALADTLLDKRHCSIQTHDTESGQGKAGAGVPGQGCGGCAFTLCTEMVDHTGESTQDGVITVSVTVNKCCIESEIELNSPKGLWVPFVNDCNTIMEDAINKCGGDWDDVYGGYLGKKYKGCNSVSFGEVVSQSMCSPHFGH